MIGGFKLFVIMAGMKTSRSFLTLLTLPGKAKVSPTVDSPQTYLLATYAVGPYIKTNITDKAKSLEDVKNEFLKYLEIEVNDLTALNWFTIQRKQTERPLVFFYRLRYHITKHLVKSNAIVDGVALTADETLSPSLERLIVMEWLHRMDPRLIKFVQEKFSTELSAGSTVLSTMVETLAKNIDQYITVLNSSGSASVGAVSISSPHNPSFICDDSTDEQEATIGYQSSFRGSGSCGHGFRGVGGYRGRSSQSRRGSQSQRGRGSHTTASYCEYCYIQSKTRNVDYRHPIERCPEMAAMHGSVHMVDTELDYEEVQHFETAAEEFINQLD